MGIKQLLPSLKGLQGTYGNFPEPHFKGVRIALDAAGLLHGCARRHLSAYEAKDYGPALAEFQRTMAYNISICCWQCVIVFDFKCHERIRRDERQTTEGRSKRFAVQRNGGESVPGSLHSVYCGPRGGRLSVSICIARSAS